MFWRRLQGSLDTFKEVDVSSHTTCCVYSGCSSQHSISAITQESCDNVLQFSRSSCITCFYPLSPPQTQTKTTILGHIVSCVHFSGPFVCTKFSPIAVITIFEVTCLFHPLPNIAKKFHPSSNLKMGQMLFPQKCALTDLILWSSGTKKEEIGKIDILFSQNFSTQQVQWKPTQTRQRKLYEISQEMRSFLHVVEPWICCWPTNCKCQQCRRALLKHGTNIVPQKILATIKIWQESLKLPCLRFRIDRFRASPTVLKPS